MTQMEFIASENRVKAYELCKDIDPKDAVYVALCLEREADLWTGDKKLIRHLTEQGFDHFFCLDYFKEAILASFTNFSDTEFMQ